MSEVSILTDGHEWAVWIQLEAGNPLLSANSFIVGIGITREAAVADAVSELEAVIERLQSPPGAITERGVDGRPRAEQGDSTAESPAPSAPSEATSPAHRPALQPSTPDTR